MVISAMREIIHTTSSLPPWAEIRGRIRIDQDSRAPTYFLMVH
jgi:hypothetical protein